MKEKVQVVLVQMSVLSGSSGPKNKSINVSRAIEIIEGSGEADLFVLPDEFYSGYGYGLSSMPDFTKRKHMETFRELASRKKAHIAFSTLLQDDIQDKFLSNSCGVLIGPSGDLVGVQKKLHVGEREREWVCPGERMDVFDTDLGRIAFVTGCDSLYVDAWGAAKEQGVEIVINPLNFIKNHENVVREQLPRDFYDYSVFYESAAVFHAMSAEPCFVLSCSAIGPYGPAPKFNSVGCTRIVFPNGKILRAEAADVECVLMAELAASDLTACHELRKESLVLGGTNG